MHIYRCFAVWCRGKETNIIAARTDFTVVLEMVLSRISYIFFHFSEEPFASRLKQMLAQRRLGQSFSIYGIYLGICRLITEI